VSAALIRCEGLSFGYKGQALLPPLSLSLCPGEFWAVVGRNGAGKSTLLRTLLGLRAPIAGACHRAPDARVAWVPQRLALDPIVPLTAGAIVAMGLERGRSVLRPAPKGARARVRAALEEAGTLELEGANFSSLSEGQQQRVLLARALAGAPELLLLDEPTAAMDLVAERALLEVVDGLRVKRGMAVLMVAHHLPLVAELATHCLFLDGEAQRIELGSPDEIFRSEAFAQSYGAPGALAQAAPIEART